MQTFPCGHRVVCRKCFVKTIQVAVSQRLLPLRCVVCRAKILRLRQSRDGPFPSSVSQYSMSAYGNGTQHHVMPASHSLYSFTSGSSGFSGVSSVSSASSESGGSMRGNAMRTAKVYRQGSRPQIIKKVKVSSKSGARDKEPLKGELPLIRIDNFDVIPVRFAPITRSPRAIIRENKVAPQDVTLNNRLPTIKEYGEFISERDIEIDKSSSTRIRCAQKLVNQLELNNNNSNNNNNNFNNNNINFTNPNTNNNIYQPNLKVPLLKVLGPTPSPPRKATIPTSKSSSSIKSSSKSPSSKPTASTAAKSSFADKKFTNKYASYSGGGGNASCTKTGSGPVKSSSVNSKLATGGKSSSNTKSSSSNNGSSSNKVKNDRRDSSSSSASIKSSPSITSNISIISSKSSGSARSSSSTQSSSSYKSATSNNSSTRSSTSSFSTSSTLTIKSCRSLIPSLRKDTPCQKGIKEDFDKIGSSPKHEYSKAKSQKKRFEGREYHRLH